MTRAAANWVATITPSQGAIDLNVLPFLGNGAVGEAILVNANNSNPEDAGIWVIDSIDENTWMALCSRRADSVVGQRFASGETIGVISPNNGTVPQIYMCRPFNITTGYDVAEALIDDTDIGTRWYLVFDAGY